MKTKQQTKLYIVIAVLTLICLSLTGLTFAWFTDKVTIDDFVLEFGKIELETDSSKVTHTSVDVDKITRANGASITNNHAMPGDKVYLNITIKLTEESQPAYYLVYFEESMFSCNRQFFFKDGSNVYATNGTDSKMLDEDGTLSETNTSTHKVGSISRDEVHNVSFVLTIDKTKDKIDLGESKTFSCTVYAIQQANMDEDEAYKEIRNQVYTAVTFGTGATLSLTASGDLESFTLPSWKQAITDFYKYQTISFYKTGEQPNTLTYNSDLTTAFDEKQAENELETGLIEVYTNGTTELAFVSNCKIMAPEKSYDLFGFSEIQLGIVDIGDFTVSEYNYTMNFDNFYTDNVVEMGSSNFEEYGEGLLYLGMFSYNALLCELDLSGWNTSNVTSMVCMFYGCANLTSLNLSGWDTSNIGTFVVEGTTFSSMYAMFMDAFDNGGTLTIGTNFKNQGADFTLTDLVELTGLDSEVVVKRNGTTLE